MAGIISLEEDIKNHVVAEYITQVFCIIIYARITYYFTELFDSIFVWMSLDAMMN